MDRVKKTSDLFTKGFNCAQSVVHGFADRLGIDPDLALKLSNGFGGGLGRKRHVCGAITGGVIVLGCLYGRGENDGKEKQETTYAKVRQLLDAFEKKFGAISCRLLLGENCDLLTPEGQALYKTRNLWDKCASFVAGAAGIMEKLVEEK